MTKKDKIIECLVANSWVNIGDHYRKTINNIVYSIRFTTRHLILEKMVGNIGILVYRDSFRYIGINDNGLTVFSVLWDE